MRLPLEQLPASTLRPLADRAHRAHLHRLNGTVQLLVGWAGLGLAGEEDQARYEATVPETTGLTRALHALWNRGTGITPELALSNDWPQRLLHAALRDGTPEEAEAPLPVGGGVALAAALWVEAVAGEAEHLKSAWATSEEGCLELRLEAHPLRTAPADLMQALRGWIEELPTAAGEAPLPVRLRLIPRPAENPAEANEAPPAAEPARD